MPIVKASLSFAGKYLWAVIHTRIQLTQADNTLTPDRTVLVTDIASHDIDFAHCIVAEMHKCALKRSTSIPFSCLIDKLCIEVGAEILPNVTMIIEVQRMQDNLIKADENPVAIW